MKSLLKSLIVLGCLCTFTGFPAAAADSPTVVMADQANTGRAGSLPLRFADGRVIG